MGEAEDSRRTVEAPPAPAGSGDARRVPRFGRGESGFVSEIEGVVGHVVGPEDHVVEIVDLAKVYVRGTADSRDLGAVTLGRKARARFVAHPGRVFDVELSATTQILDPATRVLSLYGPLANDDGALVPGMSGDLFVVVGARPESVVVPRDAVLFDASGPSVVIAEKDTYRVVPIVLGESDDRVVQVLQGVFPGDHVVVSGKEGIRTGLATLR